MSFKVGDEVVTLESRYIVGDIDCPIKTGTFGIIVRTFTEFRDTVWVNFNGDIQCVYTNEIRKLTKLELAMK